MAGSHEEAFGPKTGTTKEAVDFVNRTSHLRLCVCALKITYISNDFTAQTTVREHKHAPRLHIVSSLFVPIWPGLEDTKDRLCAAGARSLAVYVKAAPDFAAK